MLAVVTATGRGELHPNELHPTLSHGPRVDTGMSQNQEAERSLQWSADRPQPF